MNYLWSRGQKWNRRTQIAIPVWQGLLAEDVLVQSCAERKILVTWLLRITKILSEERESRNNHRCAVVVQDLAKQWLQSYPCKTKTSQETYKSLLKFLEPTRKRKVIYIDNSLEFGKSCEELSWNHCTSTPHRSETNGIAERAVRRVNEGTSAVLFQWTTNGGWIPWNVTAICETFKISCLMGRHHMKGGSECPLTDHWYRLEQWSNITLSLRRTYRDYISLVQNSCQVYSLVMYCVRKESGKETLWSQTLKNWRRWAHQNSTPKRLNAKEVSTLMKGAKFIFQVADGTVKTPEGDRRLKPSTLIRNRPERGEEQEVFRGESDELSSPTPFQDDFTRDDAEAKNDFWSMSGNFIYRHHVVPRVKLYMPREESYPIPLKYIDVTRNTHTSLDVLLERKYRWLLERGWRKRIVRCMDRLHKIHLLNERPPDGFSWSGIETYEETNNLKTRQCMARYVEAYAWCSEHWRAIEKPKLDNARQLRGFFFIEPENEEFRHIINNARRKLELPMPAAMPCKTPANCNGETCRTIGKRKTKFACIVDADESMRIRLEGVPHRYHEDHIATLVHKFIPMPQALKNTRCEGCCGNRMGKWKNTGMAADKGQKQERGDRRSKE